VADIYAGLQPISIDYGVMEKAGEVLVIPGSFGWSDLGSWTPCGGFRKGRKRERRSRRVHRHRCRGLAGPQPGKLVALVGVRDLLVVETEDALLVCRRGRSQDVRKVVEEIEKRGRKEYL